MKWGGKENYNLVGKGNPTSMIVASTTGRYKLAPNYHLWLQTANHLKR